jgi:hypothetical protein
MRRWRWTRKAWHKARSLSRYFARHVYDLPSEPPTIVQRLWDLQERHPQRDDPLERPVRMRLYDRRNFDDSIPF